MEHRTLTLHPDQDASKKGREWRLEICVETWKKIQGISSWNEVWIKLLEPEFYCSCPRFIKIEKNHEKPSR